MRPIFVAIVLLLASCAAVAQPAGPRTPGAADPATPRSSQTAPDLGSPAPDVSAAVKLMAENDTPDAVTLNPLRALADAGGMMTGDAPAGQSSDGDGLAVAINVMVLLTVISLAPSIMLMTTCFVRIIIVLSLLRQAIGVQTLPPSQVITGLALFMTAMVMTPTIDRIWDEAVEPWRAGEIRDYDTLWQAGQQPLRDFMFDQIEATGNWSSVYAVLNYRGVDTSDPGQMTRSDVPTTVLVPAYMLSELKVGFLMGFRIYLPFLVIDMVISTILISMSMMMLPPVLISLPFKLLLFVLVDGWTLVVGSLLESFAVGDGVMRLSAEPAAAALLLFALPRRGLPGNDPHRPPPRPRRWLKSRRPKGTSDGH